MTYDKKCDNRLTNFAKPDKMSCFIDLYLVRFTTPKIEEQHMNLFSKLFALVLVIACFSPANAAVTGFELPGCDTVAADDKKDDKKKEDEEEPDCE